MRIDFKPSFDRSLKALHANEKEALKKAAKDTVDVLTQDRFISKGIGLKHLRGDYWEVRKGLKARILFKWKGDLIEFILAGNHDDIKRFLKNI